MFKTHCRANFLCQAVHKLQNATEKVVFRTNVSIQNSIHIWAYIIV